MRVASLAGCVETSLYLWPCLAESVFLAPMRKVFSLLVLSCLLGSCSVVPEVSPSRYETIVLGMIQDGGLPHVGCEKVCCRQARRGGRFGYPACLAIHDRQEGKLVLLEATPAIEAQLDLLHRLTGTQARGRKPVDAVLITHAHIGHYLGLAHLGREVASTKRMPVFVTPRMAGFLRGNGPWSQLVKQGEIDLQEITPGEAFSPIPGIAVTAITVPHRDEYADTVGFKISGPNRTVLFLPDIDAWGPDDTLLDRLLEGVDIAYLDGSFYDKSELPDRLIATVPHPPVIETVERLAARARAEPGALRFIHLNHTNPLLREAGLRLQIEKRGFRIARRGEREAL